MLEIAILLVAGFINGWIISLLTILAATPGTLIACFAGSRKWLWFLASAITVLGMLYVALALTAWATSFVRVQIMPKTGILLDGLAWIIAFFVSNSPAWRLLGSSTKRIKKAIQEGVRDEALAFQHKAYSALINLSVIGFFVLAFAPKLVEMGWGWIPFIVVRA